MLKQLRQVECICKINRQYIADGYEIKRWRCPAHGWQLAPVSVYDPEFHQALTDKLACTPIEKWKDFGPELCRAVEELTGVETVLVG